MGFPVRHYSTLFTLYILLTPSSMSNSPWPSPPASAVPCSTSSSVRLSLPIRLALRLLAILFQTGIGLSGSYMVIINDYEPLHVKMGRTLIVSGVGLLVILLSTLVLVPLNGFWMNKKLGAGLILAYTVR